MEGVGDVAAADVVDGEEVFLKEELLDGARYTGIDGAVAGGVINAGFAGEGAAVGVKFGVAQAEGQAVGDGAEVGFADGFLDCFLEIFDGVDAAVVVGGATFDYAVTDGNVVLLRPHRGPARVDVSHDVAADNAQGVCDPIGKIARWGAPRSVYVVNGECFVSG